MININKKPSDTHIKTLKEILEDITEKFRRRYLTWLNRWYKIHSRNFKTPKIKNLSRHRNK
jgi:hypothetical protein